MGLVIAGDNIGCPWKGYSQATFVNSCDY